MTRTIQGHLSVGYRVAIHPYGTLPDVNMRSGTANAGTHMLAALTYSKVRQEHFLIKLIEITNFDVIL